MRAIRRIVGIIAGVVLGLAAHGAPARAAVAVESGVIIVDPGDDLQAAIDDAGEGAMLILRPGIYRGQSLAPRPRQTFLGGDGVVLRGSRPVSAVADDEGVWRIDDLPDPQRRHGFCLSAMPLCAAREDLFIDNRLLRPVAAKRDLRPGTWFRDGNQGYLVDEPAGRALDLGTTAFAFGGDATEVTLIGLTIEHYASRAQQGAVNAGPGWRLIDLTVRWNHGSGLRLADRVTVIGGRYNDNGQLGIGGSGNGVTIDGAEMARNNYAGFGIGWEAGGMKAVRADGLIVRRACVHDNHGTGIWLDTDVINAVIDGNRSFGNTANGIQYEISDRGIIRNNIVAGNGRHRTSPWGSQILVQNSSRVDVVDNVVEVPADGGDGVRIFEQDRGAGRRGPRVSAENRVRGNTIIHLAAQGTSGVSTDTLAVGLATNAFSGNRYVVPRADGPYWVFQHLEPSAPRWPEVGTVADVGAELTVESRRPLALACPDASAQAPTW